MNKSSLLTDVTLAELSYEMSYNLFLVLKVALVGLQSYQNVNYCFKKLLKFSHLDFKESFRFSFSK